MPLRFFTFSGFLLFLQCNSMFSELCPDCISSALSIKFIDASTKTAIEKARVVVTNNEQDTTIYCDSCEESWYWSAIDSTYNFPGSPGWYSFTFSHSEYTSFGIATINVKQSKEYSCDYSNTRHFIIEVNKKDLKKSTRQSGFTIIQQFEKGECL